MKSSSEKEKVLKIIRNALLDKAEIPFAEIDMDSNVYNPIEDDHVMVFADDIVDCGGRFIYCINEAELINKLASLINNRKWHNVITYENTLHSYLAANGIINSISNAEEHEVGLSLCHSIAARTGSIILTSKQGISNGSFKFPPIFIIITYTSQITSEIKTCINSLSDNMPEWVSIIKSNNLLQEEIKELYFFVIESSTK